MQMEQNGSEVLSHLQQLDSIDEAGIDAVSMLPNTDHEDTDFVFLWTHTKKPILYFNWKIDFYVWGTLPASDKNY